MRRTSVAAGVAIALLTLTAAAAGEPLGAYPPGMSGGQVPLGAYPPNRPPTVPDPAPSPAPPPALADDTQNYCLRNPAVCNMRQPDTHDLMVDRQKQFQERMRALEFEIGRGRQP